MSKSDCKNPSGTDTVPATVDPAAVPATPTAAAPDRDSPPKILDFLFELLTLIVSSVLLLLMVIYPAILLMYYLGFALVMVASCCGGVAIRTRFICFHIPCMILAILSSLNFLAISAITLYMVFLGDEWADEHLIVYIAFNVIWFAVGVALLVRHILIFRQRRALRNAQPLSYKSFGD